MIINVMYCYAIMRKREGRREGGREEGRKGEKICLNWKGRSEVISVRK
jgi:hypothetical protein